MTKMCWLAGIVEQTSCDVKKIQLLKFSSAENVSLIREQQDHASESNIVLETAVSNIYVVGAK